MCDASQPCRAAVRVACACGRRVAERACAGASAANAQPLDCDDVCRVALRNRRLALALDLPDRADAPLAGLVRATYPDALLDFARTNTSWVRSIEHDAAAFVADPRRATLRFGAMKRQLREFLHALAPFYGCASRAVDHEPHRSVCWDRPAASSSSAPASVPSIILSAAIRYAHAPQILCSLRAEDGNDSDASARSARPARCQFDYIVIRDLRHGLTADELAAEIRGLVQMPFTLRWMPDDRVELFCSDAAAKHDHLPKCLAVLKKKLPLMGVAGLVTAAQATAQPKPRSPASASSAQTSSSLLPAAAPSSTENAGNHDNDDDDDDDDSVPENWESLNLNDPDDSATTA